MIKIFVIHANNANRGDEAAIHAMVDELSKLYNNVQIAISINGRTVYPNMPNNVTIIPRFPALGSKISMVEFMLCMKTKGKIAISKQAKLFMKYMKEADIILHAPGGPSIGDIYSRTEFLSLERLNLARKLGKKYMFYAPSMGPFENKKRNPLRKKVISSASKIVVRDPISQKYVEELLLGKSVEVALDSALQHDIDINENEKKLKGYKELNDFLNSHQVCVGITITDLLWHPKYRGNPANSEKIRTIFDDFIDYLLEKGVGIVFVPQLYGTENDSNLMRSFAKDSHNFFVVNDDDERYDAYFQQYVISKLYAVIGMRYHSNIFSAKMGVPFVSISYEQKMEGFMQKMGLQQYCIPIDSLTNETLKYRYELMVRNHNEYRDTLVALHSQMKQESYKTTTLVKEVLERQ